MIGKLMTALFNGLTDRNSTIRRSYATSLANVCKLAKDSSVEKLLGKLYDWYMEKQGEYYLLHYIVPDIITFYMFYIIFYYIDILLYYISVLYCDIILLCYSYDVLLYYIVVLYYCII